MDHMTRWAVGASLMTASVLLAGGSAIAQNANFAADPRIPVDATRFPHVADTLAEQMEDTFYTNDQNYYNNRSIGRQVLWFFGLSHTDQEINRDGAAISSFVDEAWFEQNNSTGLVRTMDLPNPYQSSLLLDPTVPVQSFPPTTLRQPIAPPPIVATPRNNNPVPALW